MDPAALDLAGSPGAPPGGARAVATARQLAGESPLPPSAGWDLHRAAEALGAAGQAADAACELGLRIAGDDLLLQAALLKALSADLSDLGRPGAARTDPAASHG